MPRLQERWSQIVSPVRLPPDERVILSKRESLRARGIAWLGLLLWLVGLSSAGLTSLALDAGSDAWLRPFVDTGLIVLMIGALPIFFLIYYRAWQGVFVLTSDRLISSEDTIVKMKRRPHKDAGTAPPFRSPSDISLRRIRDVKVAPKRGLGRMISLGDVVITTHDRGESLILRHVDHPDAVAEEIRRQARQAAGESKSEVGHHSPTERRRISLSIAWVLLQWLPIGILMWVLVVAWVVLRLPLALSPQAIITATTYIGLTSTLILVPWWLVSFLRWWCKVYLVTERRVIYRSGLLNIIRRDLSLDDVVSATIIKSGLGRLFDVGHIQVMTAGLSGDIFMHNVSGPDHIRRLILESQDRLRRQREQLQMGDITQRLKLSLHM